MCQFLQRLEIRSLCLEVMAAGFAILRLGKYFYDDSINISTMIQEIQICSRVCFLVIRNQISQPIVWLQALVIL